MIEQPTINEPVATVTVNGFVPIPAATIQAIAAAIRKNDKRKTMLKRGQESPLEHLCPNGGNGERGKAVQMAALQVGVSGSTVANALLAKRGCREH